MKAAHPTTRLLFVGLALVVLLGIVAFAVRGHTAPASSGAHDRNASQVLASVVFTLMILMMGAGAVVLAYLIAQKRMQKREPVRSRSRILALLIFAALFAVLAGAQRQFGDGKSHRRTQANPISKINKKLLQAERERRATRPAPPSFEWRLAVGIRALIAGIAATALLRSLRRRSELIEKLTVEQELYEMLDETLDDLYGESDPRKAVIAAYARMERILAAHGLPRAPAEAPLEYLSRVLLELKVSRLAVRRLTRLFERAKFSQHTIDASMKEQAIEALVSIRDDLRPLEPPSERPLPPLDEAPRPAS